MQNEETVVDDFVMACTDDDVPLDGTVITRTVNGRPIAFARRSPGEPVVVAFDPRCPHMQGPLRFGRVIDGEVVCPWHFMRFDTQNGETVGCPGSVMHLKTYPVAQANGQISILISG